MIFLLITEMPKIMYTYRLDNITFCIVFKRSIPPSVIQQMKLNSLLPVIYTQYVEKMFTLEDGKETIFDIVNTTGEIEICGKKFCFLIRPGLQKNVVHSTCGNCFVVSFNEINDKIILPSKTATLYLEGLQSTCVYVKLDSAVAEIHVNTNEFHESIQDTKEFYIEIPRTCTEKDFHLKVNYRDYHGKMFNLMDKQIKVCKDLTIRNSMSLKKVCHKKKTSSKKSVYSK